MRLRITVDAPDDFEPFDPFVDDGADKREESKQIILAAIAGDDYDLEEIQESANQKQSALDANNEIAMQGHDRWLERSAGCYDQE